ncbi:MAG: hypothetical protein K8T20_12745 [Planctomycetes bacterium]|nr:hypothetical protein [Planctomycetota bacterium]
MSRRALIVVGGLVVAGVAAFVIERLIVTDKEAILMTAAHAVEAIERGDVAEGLKVLHPLALTEAGNPEATRRALEEQLRQMPLDHVNFMVRSLEVENGTGKMSVDVMVLPKDPKKAGSSVFRVGMAIDWVKEGKDWKIRRADIK